MKLAAASVIAWAVGLWTPVYAQDYPTRPITVVVPTTPGGVMDRIARTIGQRLSTKLSQPIVVEHRAGANHQLGAALVAKARPDGYTLLISPEGLFVANPYLYKTSRDFLKELSPIAGLFRTEAALVAARNLPIADLRGLLALAAAKPGELSYGTFGLGSSGHLAMELLQIMTQTRMLAVHYKGAGPAFNDVLGDHIAAMFINPGTAVPVAAEGRVKLLAIASEQRLAQFPSIPTVAEAGIPGFTAGSWFGLFAPAATPSGVVQKLNAEIQAVHAELMKEEKFLISNTFTPIQGSQEEFGQFIREEAKKWSAIIRAANLKAE